MTISVNDTRGELKAPGTRWAGRLGRLGQLGIVREVFVILVFCLLTTIVTWPYVTRLRDVVVDTGDPYLCAWILWWDYHQTFTNPLHLFDANVFYPLKYSLAFSENSYGIALLFFPLFAIGLTPLTVHAIAMFLGFALNGYGAFRLGRTISGSTAIGWVSGIVFAFVPYRFNMMSQVMYLFSPWIPLVFEALVLFARKSSNKRAAWLGFAFFMSGLSTITWWSFSLIPLLLYAVILATRYDLWRERAFWKRGTVALAIAGVALLPFLVPYVLASRLYGFKRSIDEIKRNSAWPSHWLSVENRNKLWNRMGEGVYEGWKFKLFPGLLPILFSLAELFPQRTSRPRMLSLDESNRRHSYQHWVPFLDVIITFFFALALISIGFDRTNAFLNLFDHLTSERTLSLLTLAIAVRLCIAYPKFLHATRQNLVETLRSQDRSDTFWLGSILCVMGFFLSLGWNFFLYRILYELLPIFKSVRVVSRWSLLAYLGLGLLAGLGVRNLAERLELRYQSVKQQSVFIVACVLLLIEFNGAPLSIVRGESFPDAVTLRMKQTTMRGGIVYLPAGGDNNYRYMLRAADHQKPLIVGTSGFNSPIEDKIEILTREGAIKDELMTLLESVPTSYLIIANPAVPPERTMDYQVFLARQLSAGRLRYINRFDGQDDLYAVVQNEPQASSEATLPVSLSIGDWAGMIHDDPVLMLGQPLQLSQRLYRLHMVTTGSMPRFSEFKTELEELSRGVVIGAEGNEEVLSKSFGEFVNKWIGAKRFVDAFAHLDDVQYVNQLIQNAGISVESDVRRQFSSNLSNGQETRATALLKIVDHPRFIEKENNRSLVLLHYFGYLRRNPDDPPDGDLRGFYFWLDDLNRNHSPDKLASAFRLTGEYHQFEKKP